MFVRLFVSLFTKRCIFVAKLNHHVVHNQVIDVYNPVWVNLYNAVSTTLLVFYAGIASCLTSIQEQYLDQERTI